MSFWQWLDELVRKFLSYFEVEEEKPQVKYPEPQTPLLAELEKMFWTASILSERRFNVRAICSKITTYKDQYTKVEFQTGVPWFVVACIHSLESSLNFSTHLHNGDPLTARTKRVPKGRPSVGVPPFAWYESAIDALGGAGAHKGKDWSLGYCLDFLEKYNGLGYRKRGIPSPYLWSFTNHYTKGKFVQDGKFDPEFVSKQVGAAAILIGLDVFNDKKHTLPNHKTEVDLPVV